MRKNLFVLFVLISVTISAKSQSMFGRDWQPGSYNDTLGHHIQGLLNMEDYNENVFVNNQHFIYFKKTKKSDKVKVYADSLKSFVIGTDSFTVTHLPAFAKGRFLQVMINRGVKLYYTPKLPTYAMLGGGLIPALLSADTYKSRYYYGPDADNLTALTGKNFIEIMSQIMADKPEMVALVKIKTYKMGSINDLVVYYNTGKKPVAESYYTDN